MHCTKCTNGWTQAMKTRLRESSYKVRVLFSPELPSPRIAFTSVSGTDIAYGTDGIVETWLQIIPPKSFDDPKGPQPTRERTVRYPGVHGFLTVDECVSKVESCRIEVQQIRIHRWHKIGPRSSRMTQDELPWFSQPPTHKQEQEAGQYAHCCPPHSLR